jgi:NAD(P)-dependent dehydrogenase (short-subunit alcohol dehydrogenase family)
MAESPEVVLVSGASTGIGKAAALRLAREGFQVLGGIRRLDDGASLVDGAVEPVVLDVTDGDSVAAATEHALDRGKGRVAGLVNNAGVTVNGAFETLTMTEWRDQFEVNFFGHLAVTKALLLGLRDAGGRVVNVGSIGGRVALPLLGPYTASKFAMRGWTESLRMELAPDGVRVALVEPGAIDTEIWRKGADSAAAIEAALTAEQRQRYGERITATRKAADRASRHAVSPDRVARVIAHALTSRRPRARYVVGPDAQIERALAIFPAAVLDRGVRLATGMPR